MYDEQKLPEQEMWDCGRYKRSRCWRSARDWLRLTRVCWVLVKVTRYDVPGSWVSLLMALTFTNAPRPKRINRLESSFASKAKINQRRCMAYRITSGMGKNIPKPLSSSTGIR